MSLWINIIGGLIVWAATRWISNHYGYGAGYKKGETDGKAEGRQRAIEQIMKGEFAEFSKEFGEEARKKIRAFIKDQEIEKRCGDEKNQLRDQIKELERVLASTREDHENELEQSKKKAWAEGLAKGRTESSQDCLLDSYLKLFEKELQEAVRVAKRQRIEKDSSRKKTLDTAVAILLALVEKMRGVRDSLSVILNGTFDALRQAREDGNEDEVINQILVASKSFALLQKELRAQMQQLAMLIDEKNANPIKK